jgi:hypothetical protein
VREVLVRLARLTWWEKRKGTLQCPGTVRENTEAPVPLGLFTLSAPEMLDQAVCFWSQKIVPEVFC